MNSNTIYANLTPGHLVEMLAPASSLPPSLLPSLPETTECRPFKPCYIKNAPECKFNAHLYIANFSMLLQAKIWSFVSNLKKKTAMFQPLSEKLWVLSSLIDILQCYWPNLIDVDWCWLMLIDADWCWLIDSGRWQWVIHVRAHPWTSIYY